MLPLLVPVSRVAPPRACFLVGATLLRRKRRCFSRRSLALQARCEHAAHRRPATRRTAVSISCHSFASAAPRAPPARPCYRPRSGLPDALHSFAQRANPRTHAAAPTATGRASGRALAGKARGRALFTRAASWIRTTRRARLAGVGKWWMMRVDQPARSQPSGRQRDFMWCGHF